MPDQKPSAHVMHSGVGGGCIDDVLVAGVESGAVLGVSGAAWSGRGTYSGAAGEARTGLAMVPSTVVRMMSMTKAVTAAAVMQLVEQGLVGLDDPAGDWVPYLASVQVLDGFDAAGSPRLRAPRGVVTLRNLLAHTSGFAYDFTDVNLARYLSALPEVPITTQAWFERPLTSDPGERWVYGIGCDWAGRVIEAVSGQDLETYFDENLLAPLGMVDTTFRVTAEVATRLAQRSVRTPSGLEVVANEPIDDGKPLEMAAGGGGLYSTVIDYLAFNQMILGRGVLDGVRVLSAESVAEMSRDQLGGLSADGWTSVKPEFSADVELYPGQRAVWGLSFSMNTEDTDAGRSAGSLSWAGAHNTFFWIDPKREVTGVFATQTTPFYDPRVLDVWERFERAVYASLG